MSIVEYHATLSVKYLMNKYSKSELIRLQNKLATQLREYGVTSNPEPDKITVGFWEDADERYDKWTLAHLIMIAIDWLDKFKQPWFLL